MRPSSWADLPDALRDALDACWRALDERPWEHPDELLQRAVLDALGIVPRVLRGGALDAARALRPDLADQLDRDGGVLALDEPFAHHAVRARLAHVLEGEPVPPLAIDPARVLHLRVELPAARRHRVLAWRCAQSVVPMWMHVHPDDERPLALLDAIAEGALDAHTLRDALEREVAPSDPALSALRAIVLAHDLVAQSEARVETTELPDLCAYAWLDAPAELVPDARSHEPPARAEAWFRWWLTDAVPSAWRSV
ncbi:hypothetical protein [Sandaracinus amylolyticus]|uniref:Uncharacterized protein n=1 Tax=Sandaracinus amylolyticus TaxID=927083 RepID=A0A0F6YLE2_9BACT|nr:hypothetical protein [Sandaracinus amylolyticus]AKF09120.1 hypothetical protein DB32_006269 [Sandaracinus amylolyticus]